MMPNGRRGGAVPGGSGCPPVGGPAGCHSRLSTLLTQCARPAAQLSAHTRRMSWPPTLYKARGMRKQPVCAICVERTRGRTVRVELGYGVGVWLCPSHAGAGFLHRRGGRDLVLTLQQLWQAHGCLTPSRHKALLRHLKRLEGPSLRKAERPGSYAWPRLRRRRRGRRDGRVAGALVRRGGPGARAQPAHGRALAHRTALARPDLDAALGHRRPAKSG